MPESLPGYLEHLKHHQQALLKYIVSRKLETIGGYQELTWYEYEQTKADRTYARMRRAHERASTTRRDRICRLESSIDRSLRNEVNNIDAVEF